MDEIKNKIAAQAAEINFCEDLPDDIAGFELKRIFLPHDDKFIFFTYADEEIRCSVTAYFHEETAEYKIRQKIGLTEFCLTNFFTQDLKIFKSRVDVGIERVIKNLRGLRDKKPDKFLREKEIDEWTYGKSLPGVLEGFELFIKPNSPVEVTNGSFIVINYADFEIESDFVLYYNIYSDEFSGESRIKKSPHVSYVFDAKTLSELEDKLKKNLIGELREIRRLS